MFSQTAIYLCTTSCIMKSFPTFAFMLFTVGCYNETSSEVKSQNALGQNLITCPVANRFHCYFNEFEVDSTTYQVRLQFQVEYSFECGNQSYFVGIKGGPGDPVVEKAVSLLSREHCNARLEKVWGPGDGRPVAELKQEMDQLLQEYLLSRELDEAARCVKELEAPHFHHLHYNSTTFSQHHNTML